MAEMLWRQGILPIRRNRGLSTSNRGGQISFDVNRKKLTGPIQVSVDKQPADPIAWWQWHYWNIMKDLAEVKLPKGVNVLPSCAVSEGNMNFARFRTQKLGAWYGPYIW